MRGSSDPRLAEPIATVPDDVLGELATAVLAGFADVASRIPPTPAAELGRLGTESSGLSGPAKPRTVADALSSVQPLLAERLLGALELTVAGLAPPVPEGLSALVHTEPVNRSFGVARIGVSSATTEMSTVDVLRPGLTAVVAAVTAALAARPELAGPLTVEPGDEATVAARHGAGHLAVAVLASATVLRASGLPAWAVGPPTVVGVAIGAAALALRELPMPVAYAEALLAKKRAEYLLPIHASARTPVRDHRFSVAETDQVPDVDFGENGLVAAIPGGFVVRTGVADGEVPINVTVLAEAPGEVDRRHGWDEVVELSWHAAAGSAGLIGADQCFDRLDTPPWPGDYRVRVHARGRDEQDERYEIVVWQAPAAAEIVHARGDRLGHRLRGEPEPAKQTPPDAAHRWFDQHWLAAAATITVVTGASTDDVLRGFGADPAAPASIEELQNRFDIDPWVAVLGVTGADGTAGTVFAIEPNGWQGSLEPVLRAISEHGSAASIYRSVNADCRLSFARNGVVLESYEPGMAQDAPTEPEVVAAVADLDFEEYGGRWPKALTAIERFTGHAPSERDVARIFEVGVAYPILPLLPELSGIARNADGSLPFLGRGPLGADTDRLAGLDEHRLRDLAWWAARQVAAHHGMADKEPVAGALTERALGQQAEHAARSAQLGGSGADSWVWTAVHRATNPDPLAAAIGVLDTARYGMPGAAADLLDDARAWLP